MTTIKTAGTVSAARGFGRYYQRIDVDITRGLECGAEGAEGR